MKKGFWYDANNDAELLELRENAEELCYSFNQTSPKMTEKKEKIMKNTQKSFAKSEICGTISSMTYECDIINFRRY